MEPRILFFDIETTPLISYNWGLYDQNAISLIQDWYLLCFAYKWQGEKTVYVERLQNGRKSEKELVRKLHKLFDEADIIIAHNGNPFDIKKSNAKFIEYGFKPPSPHQSIDTLKEARKFFKFTSSKLDALGEILGVGRKVKHPGIEMWQGCMADEEKWWKLMLKYNKQDVILLENVYNKLLPWLNRDKVVWNNKRPCPHCESKDTQKRGTLISTAGEFQRHQCRTCAKWFKGDKIINRV